MPTQDLAYQQRLKIRRTTLGFGVIQVILGLALTGLSFAAFALSEADRIRNACPYWAGFTVFCSGGVGVVAWRHSTILSMGLFTFFSAVCVVLHMIGTILTGEVGGLLKSVIECQFSDVDQSCICCDSIMTCKQNVPTYKFEGVEDCAIVTGLMKELMYGLCVLNIFGSLVCFIATILGCTSVARQAGRDQSLFRRRFSTRSESHEHTQYSWLPYPTDLDMLPPYAPPVYRSVDNFQDFGDTPYIVPPPVFDPTDLPPPYSSRDASLTGSGISLSTHCEHQPRGHREDRDSGGDPAAMADTNREPAVAHQYENEFPQRITRCRTGSGTSIRITSAVLTEEGIRELAHSDATNQGHMSTGGPPSESDISRIASPSTVGEETLNECSSSSVQRRAKESVTLSSSLGHHMEVPTSQKHPHLPYKHQDETQERACNQLSDNNKHDKGPMEKETEDPQETRSVRDSLKRPTETAQSPHIAHSEMQQENEVKQMNEREKISIIFNEKLRNERIENREGIIQEGLSRSDITGKTMRCDEYSADRSSKDDMVQPLVTESNGETEGYLDCDCNGYANSRIVDCADIQPTKNNCAGNDCYEGDISESFQIIEIKDRATSATGNVEMHSSTEFNLHEAKSRSKAPDHVLRPVDDVESRTVDPKNYESENLPSDDSANTKACKSSHNNVGYGRSSENTSIVLSSFSDESETDVLKDENANCAVECCDKSTPRDLEDCHTDSNVTDTGQYCCNDSHALQMRLNALGSLKCEVSKSKVVITDDCTGSSSVGTNSQMREFPTLFGRLNPPLSRIRVEDNIDSERSNSSSAASTVDSQTTLNHQREHSGLAGDQRHVVQSQGSVHSNNGSRGPVRRNRTFSRSSGVCLEIMTIPPPNIELPLEIREVGYGFLDIPRSTKNGIRKMGEDKASKGNERFEVVRLHGAKRSHRRKELVTDHQKQVARQRSKLYRPKEYARERNQDPVSSRSGGRIPSGRDLTITVDQGNKVKSDKNESGHFVPVNPKHYTLRPCSVGKEILPSNLDHRQFQITANGSLQSMVASKGNETIV